MSEGNGSVAHAEVETREVSAARRPTKLELKRAQIYQERRARAINNGVPEDKVDATLAAEDYKNSPLEEKFERFQNLAVHALQGLQQDILNLQHNDTVIADAMDINLKAMARALVHAGVDIGVQQNIMQEVEKEIHKEQQLQKAAREAAHKAASEKVEKQTIEKDIDKEAEPLPVPDGATVFGG